MVAVAVSVDPSHCECVAGGGSADRDNCGGDGSVNSDGCQWLWSSRADESGGSGGSGGGSADRDGCQWLAAVAVASVDLPTETAAGGCVPVALTSLVAAVDRSTQTAASGCGAFDLSSLVAAAVSDWST